jgi:pyruvate/2-oxoglutarate dehydrogenase complex dihydrolipoamide dehydrogenase (E3) component
MLYDLIVIGNTPEAILAATKASYLKDRIALVYPPSNGCIEAAEAIFNRRFTHLNESFIYSDNSDKLDSLTYFTQGLLSQIWGQDNLAKLSSMGIDVIIGKGEFCRLPKLGFIVNNNKLRSPFYLVATGSHSIIPNIPGLKTVGYLTAQDILGKDPALLPNNLLILGGNISAIPLAQNLGKIGKNITLVLENQKLLPEADRECSFLIQAQLESEGISLFINSPISQIKIIDGKKWVQAGNKAIETDEIIITNNQTTPKIEGLNLEGVKVKIESNGIVVNEKLQTTNEKIYACGSVISRNNFCQSAEVETEIAVNNALYFPWHKINYNHIPSIVFTSPQLAKIGLTEIQARTKYKDDLFIAREYYKNITDAQIIEQTTGFCKLIARKNGEIVGAHIMGYQAGELIATIALAINNNIRLKQLANLPLPSLTLSEILKSAAGQWQREQIRKNNILFNIINKLLFWRHKC